MEPWCLAWLLSQRGSSHDERKTFIPCQTGSGAPMSSAELTSTLSHFHRAEIARMRGWRDRLDRTTNWALTVAAASGEFAEDDAHVRLGQRRRRRP